MIIHKDISNLTPIKNPIVTVGTFDGVHIGHQKIINRLNEIAAQTSGESVLLTFHPHPRMVLFPDDDSLKLINTIDEKTALLESFGLDHVIYLPFGKEFSRLSPVEYVRDFLVNKINLHTIVIGYDHHFGRNRQGDIELLKELAPVYDFQVEEILAQEISEIKVSSTKIRRAIVSGDFDTVHRFLGHTFTISGEVVYGYKIGRTINFPTANVALRGVHKIVPQNGVYIVQCKVQKEVVFGVMNIGTKPTIESTSNISMEVHLLDFDAEIYGETIVVEFLQKIRNERKFDNLEALKKQIKMDVTQARIYLNKN